MLARLPRQVRVHVAFKVARTQLVIAVALFREPFTAAHGYGFGLIWARLACFAADA